MLTVGSLFSGIGGFDLGLERAGMRVLWQCESDDFCRRVLAKRWPGVPCYPNVCELREPERPDVLCGGFPCQDLSYAGTGAGIDGTRSGLWSEYARLIGELRPRYVVVENVSALLARGMGRVLGDLAAVGYDAEWDCVPASAVGAPHERDRLWLVAYPARDAEAGPGAEPRTVWERAGASGQPAAAMANAEVVPLRAGLCASESGGQRRGRSRNGGGAGEVADAEGVRGGARGAEQWPAGLPDWPGGAGWKWEPEPDVGRVADGVPDRVDRLRSLGNALVPQIAEWIGRRIIEWEALNVA